MEREIQGTVVNGDLPYQYLMEQSPTHGVHFIPAGAPRSCQMSRVFLLSKNVFQIYEFGERFMAAWLGLERLQNSNVLWNGAVSYLWRRVHIHCDGITMAVPHPG